MEGFTLVCIYIYKTLSIWEAHLMVFINCEPSNILTSAIVALMYISIHLNKAFLRPCNSQAFIMF